MRLNLLRKDPKEDPNGGVSIVIITGSCCIPGMAAFDEQARRVVEQAIAETGIGASVKMMPATTAYFGGAPKKVMGELIAMSNQRKLGLPAILINGRAVSYGVPTDVGSIKAALLEAASTKTIKGGVQK